MNRIPVNTNTNPGVPVGQLDELRTKLNNLTWEVADRFYVEDTNPSYLMERLLDRLLELATMPCPQPSPLGIHPRNYVGGVDR